MLQPSLLWWMERLMLIVHQGDSGLFGNCRYSALIILQGGARMVLQGDLDLGPRFEVA